MYCPYVKFLFIFLHCLEHCKCSSAVFLHCLSICKLLVVVFFCFFLHCLEHAHKNFTHQGTCAVVMWQWKWFILFFIISIQNHDSSIYKKCNCGKTLNSMYYATCRQRVCGQNKDNLCLHAVRTLIWRSCAFNRWPMTMPVLDGPMTMPVLDGVKPMAITLPICGTSESLFWKRKKSIYCWTRSRPTWTFGESNDQVRDKSEFKYQRVQDKSETIEKRLESGLEYYSPSLCIHVFVYACIFVLCVWKKNTVLDI